MITVLTDDRVDVLIGAFQLLRGGDRTGEDRAREAAQHLCWDGAADIVSDLPGADPMEPGDLRTELEFAFELLKRDELGDMALGEWIESEYQMRCAGWNVIQSERAAIRAGVASVATRVLAMSDAAHRFEQHWAHIAEMVDQVGLVGYYAPAAAR